MAQPLKVLAALSQGPEFAPDTHVKSGCLVHVYNTALRRTEAGGLLGLAGF